MVLEESTTPCQEAGEALKYAILSLFCFGFILGPVAISKAFKARKEINEDPSLTGWGKTNAAIFIGIIALVFWLYTMLHRNRGS